MIYNFLLCQQLNTRWYQKMRLEVEIEDKKKESVNNTEWWGLMQGQLGERTVMMVMVRRRSFNECYQWVAFAGPGLIAERSLL